jgi:hypothetical protein
MKKKKLMKQIKTLQAENALFREDLRVLVISTHLPEVLHRVQKCRCYLEINDLHNFGEMEKISDGIWGMLIEQKQAKTEPSAITAEAIEENIESFIEDTNGLKPQAIIFDEFLDKDCEMKEPLFPDDLVWQLNSIEETRPDTIEDSRIIFTFCPANNWMNLSFMIFTSKEKYNSIQNMDEISSLSHTTLELCELREKLRV